MDIGKISQNTINQNIQIQKQYMTDEMKEDCLFGLNNADFNGDGVTTGDEMEQSWLNVCAYEFEGNEAFLKRGEELAAKQGEIYSMYAGDDGVLDVYEYNAALQSEEMGVFIDEYNSMRIEMDAMNGEEEISGLANFDRWGGNEDGKVSASEITDSKLNTYSKLYEDSNFATKLSSKIIKQQEEILKKFEGDDGHLSSAEYSEAVNSDEYQKTMDKLNLLDRIFDWFN